MCQCDTDAPTWGHCMREKVSLNKLMASPLKMAGAGIFFWCSQVPKFGPIPNGI